MNDHSFDDKVLVFVCHEDSEKEYCYFAERGKYHVGDETTDENEEIVKIVDIREAFTPFDYGVDESEMKYLDSEILPKEDEGEKMAVNVNLSLFNVMVDIRDYFSYLEYHSDLIFEASHKGSKITFHSLIRRVEIDNQTGVDYSDVLLSFHFSNPMFRDFELEAKNITSPCRNKVEMNEDVVIDGEKLYHLNGMDACQLEVVCKDLRTGKVLDRIVKTFKVLPIRQCSENNIAVVASLFAKYCITGFSKLTELHQRAVENNDNQPLIAYQNEDNNAKIKEINALFNALHEYGINYSNPPHSVGAIQDVRLPSDVLSEKQGTCLDLALLFCSALLDVGYHPILVITPGHALVGVFLNENDTFPGFLCKSSQELYEKSINKDRDIVLINSVEIQASSKNSFQLAKQDGENHVLSNKTVIALDVYSAQVKGSYAPIPMPREDTGEIDFEIHPVTLDNAEIEENDVYIAKHIEGSVGKDRFSTWERKLLDLTTGNRLVNMLKRKEYLKDPNLAFLGSQGYEIYNLLKMKADAQSVICDTLDEYLTKDGLALSDEQMMKLASDKLNTGTLQINELTSKLKKIISKNRTALEETGSSTLYLALGTVSFDDPNSNTTKRVTGPLLLLPIDLKKKTYGDDYELKYDFEDMMINQTFFEYVRLKLDLDYNGIYAFDPESQRLEDLVRSINDLHHNAVNADSGMALISNFTFNHYVMWQDIKMRKEELRKNEIVNSLLQNRSLVEEDDYFADKTSEDLDVMSDFAAPLPYDSTQLKAIIECGRQKSFILDGPPGTGKSQTIVNMIVNAMYQGKTVLFVAEKAAALDVVKARLSKLGLDRFAMPIYGSKFTKASMFESFRRSYNQGVADSYGDFTSLLSELEDRKAIMRKELDLLHEKTEEEGELYSLYEAIVNYKSTVAFKGLLKLPKDYLLTYSPQKDEEIRKDMDKLIKVLDMIPDYFTSPISLLKIKSFGFLDQEEIKDQFNTVCDAVCDTDKAYKDLLLLFGVSASSGYADWNTLLRVFTDVFNKEILIDKLAEDRYFDDSILKAIDSVKALREIEEKAQKDFDLKALLEIDADALTQIYQSKHGFFADIMNRSKAKKILEKANKNKAKTDYDFMKLALDILADYHKEEDIYTQNKAISYDFFSKDVRDDNADLDHLRELYANTKSENVLLRGLETTDSEMYSCSMSALGSLNPFKVKQYKPKFDALAYKAYDLSEKISALNGKYPFDQDVLQSEHIVTDFTKLTDYVSDDSNSMKLEKIALYNVIAEDLVKNGLGQMITDINEKTYDYHDIQRIYENAFSYVHIYHYYDNDQKAQYFNSFSSEDYEESINRYCTLIQSYNDLCVEELKVRLTRTFKNMESISSVSIGELVKLATVNGRGTTLRNALMKYEDYFRAYFPCFMMSPMACAQLLATDSKKFDIVIFDEASQIPTSEAIGPVARGKSLIVAGDPKQMPPTSYFTANVNASDFEAEDGEAVALDDSESFLDDCISIGLPSFHLAFHYRSRHESLIQFSNHNFYEDSLFTFPSADNLHCHISFEYVDVKKKTNDLSIEEEKAILKTFRNAVLDPKHKGKSVGIIVFNTKQQAKLEDSIENLVDKDQKIREALSLCEDNYFIKNLENVQGDERDIIIMSVGFTKSVNGKAYINGPLSLDKGERRLNVAASRAKEEMIVISTIHSIDIDDSRSKNAGAAHLKDFLSYAEHASIQKTEAEEKPYKQGISYFIKQDLENKGNLVADLYVGSSGFKVDLALRKKDSDQYLVGILLDEKPLADNVSCRDRFYVQSTILKSLKWDILRIYTVEYHRHPAETIEKILTAFEDKAKESPTDKQETMEENPLPEPEPEQNALMINKKAYVPYTVGVNEHVSYDFLCKGNYSTALEKLLRNAIQAESPVSFDRIMEIAKTSLDIAKAGDKAKDIVKKHLAKLGLYTSEDLDATFYWSGKDYNSVLYYYRVSQDRNIMDIPKEEIIYLLNCYLTYDGKADRETLIRQVIDEMGVKTGRLIRDKILYCIDYAKQNGLLVSGYQEEF